MKYIIGAILGTVIFACGSGKVYRDFNDFPRRSEDNSIFMKCADGDFGNACKYECLSYDKKNKCKKNKKRVVKININKALDDGYFLVSKPFLLNLLTSKK